MVASVRNKQDDLFALVKSDFTGSNNFIFWVVSIFIIGSIGYIPKLKPFSTGFLVLVVLVLVLTRGNPNSLGGGFFQKFTQALNVTTQTTLSFPQTGTSTAPSGSTGSTVLQFPQLGSLA